MVIEYGKRCFCGGLVGLLYELEPGISQGKCFQCGTEYEVIAENPYYEDAI